MTLRKLKAQYKTITYWHDGLSKAAWHSSAMRETDEDRKIALQIEEHLHEVRKLIKQTMLPKLGNALAAAIESGEET